MNHLGPRREVMLAQPIANLAAASDIGVLRKKGQELSANWKRNFEVLHQLVHSQIKFE